MPSVHRNVNQKVAVEGLLIASDVMFSPTFHVLLIAGQSQCKWFEKNEVNRMPSSED